MAYVWCFKDEVMQVEDFIDQATLQATMNDYKLATRHFQMGNDQKDTQNIIRTYRGGPKEYYCWDFIFY